MIRITIRSREGRETFEQDSSESRAVTYFRIRFCTDGTSDATIRHCLKQTGSFSHSYAGGMARIERESWGRSLLRAGPL